ncbi:MAG: hypothetical protein RL196_580 [Actinomycetota bacterium]
MQAIATSVIFMLAFGAAVAPANAATASKGSAITAKGPKGQTLRVAVTKNIKDGTAVSVVGKGYDVNTGIYLTYCVVPKKGKRPEICGPFDVTGQSNDSYWISNNPPIYAALFVDHFGPKGTFKLSIKVKRFIDSYDCKKVQCAVLTRADHTASGNRSADLIVPVTIK